MEIDDGMTIGELKQAVAIKMRVKPSSIGELIHAGKQLLDDSAKVSCQWDTRHDTRGLWIVLRAFTYYFEKENEDWDWDMLDETVDRIRKLDYRPRMPPRSLSIGEPSDSREMLTSKDLEEQSRLIDLFPNDRSKHNLCFSLFDVRGQVCHSTQSRLQPASIFSPSNHS